MLLAMSFSYILKNAIKLFTRRGL